MDKCRQNLSIDPFRITGEGMLDRIILDTSLRDIDDSRMRERDVRRWDEKVRPIIRSRTDNRYKRLVARITVSAIGAGFLIGPMWLMMLKTGLYVALISTSIFVAVFGIMMACVLDEHINVLSSTAAYAAVLVVFVGLRGEATGDTG
jgi:VIT1/CCC1 family predicted Fe2+/Mn2+ transporter